MRPSFFLLGVAPVVALISCAPTVQRAAISPTPIPSIAESARDAITGRYELDPARSSLEIFASDAITGGHRLTVKAWSAHVETTPAFTVDVTIDVGSLEGDSAVLTRVAKERLLEVAKYPRASLVATLTKTKGAPDEYVAEGTATLHGISRGIRVVGTMHAEGDGYRFRTDFVVSRLDFNVRYGGAFEVFLKNDVRIHVDARVVPK